MWFCAKIDLTPSVKMQNSANLSVINDYPNTSFSNQMNNKEKKKVAFEFLSLDETEINTFEDKEDIFRILIIQRGEMLFFARNNKCVFIEEFSALNSKISFKNIEKWIDGSKILDKVTLIKDIQLYYKKAYKDTLEIV